MAVEIIEIGPAKAWNSTLPVPKKPMKRTAFKRKFAKKTNKTELWRSYGLTRPPKPRYTGLKGIYWHLLSEYTRRRDFDLFEACIGCGRKVTSWKELQGGHFIAAERCGWKLLFDTRNVNGECGGCNAYDKQKLGYERRLDERYGEGWTNRIKDDFFEGKKGTPAKQWSQFEYNQNIIRLQAELKALQNDPK